MNMNTSIYIATQKTIDIPHPRFKIYKTLYVGVINDISKYGGPYEENSYFDNTGDNISERNPYYCELTGLYWIWKNDTSNIAGLCHYRRYFVTKRGKLIKLFFPFINTGYLTEKDIKKYLLKYDFIAVPTNYKKSTVLQAYSDSHFGCDLEVIRAIISENCPDYISAFDEEMESHSGFICNLMIARKSVLDEYCSWLFNILFKAEKRIPYKNYDAYQRRVFGYLAERLLGVWIRKNRIKVKRCQFMLTS